MNLSFRHQENVLASPGDRRANARRSRKRPQFPLAVEPLEERYLLAVFTVTITADTGLGSLRQAILDANANTGLDRIEFAIDSGAQTISPRSALPIVTGPVEIDGTTQPGYKGTPIIELNGGGAGSSSAGLRLGGPGGSTVRGLVINRFFSFGISAGSNNRIVGNYIGTDLTGTRSLGNQASGVSLGGENNTVGGTAPEDRNLISGNSGSGIYFAAGRNVVQGNLIGTDVTGAKPLGNNFAGVSLVQALGGLGVWFNVIGGLEPGAGNVISGNGGPGIGFSGTIWGGGPQDNSFLGNYIGTDATGTKPLGNRDEGVRFGLVAAHNIFVGNLIGFNGGHGVFVPGMPHREHVFEANAVFGNAGDGFRIRQGDRILIGGPNEGEGNVIAFNGGHGILLEQGSGNALRGNSVFGNVEGGIALLNANWRQPSPELTAAVSFGGGLTVSGWLYSRGGERFELDFFASSSCHESGSGEGELFLGARAVETDADWFASIEELFEADVPAGWVVTATATDVYGNTSAFSSCVEVQEPGGPAPGARVPLDAAVLAALTAKRTEPTNRGGA